MLGGLLFGHGAGRIAQTFTDQFDVELRARLEDIVGTRLDDDRWGQARQGVSVGGWALARRVQWAVLHISHQGRKRLMIVRLWAYGYTSCVG